MSDTDLAAKQRLALTLKAMQAKIDALERGRNEPIAVVGIGCRFPGQSNTPDRFWQLLREGRDAITEVPASRWDAGVWYDPDPETPGKMYTRWGGFLDGVDCFDAGFFGISPREAISLDPQQRLLLEVAWEALEHAGIPADRLAGTGAGVFAGISGNDYAQLGMRFSNPALLDAYSGTGSIDSVAAGRVSYILGLQGPNFPVDTACSSSLLAVHLACQSLRAGECRLALAGGVNLTLQPVATVYFCKMRALSPDGRCKTFDASANGYVRGEGCGVIVLKRLSDAVAEGDRILGVIRGSAVNHDGRSNGLTAPNGAAQEAVIKQAIKNANLLPADVGYIEAHGTGTSLGDPIEVQALAAAYGQGRASDRPLMLGSVKTNIGHLEAAAGVAGLIKALLVVQQGHVPPHLHLRQPNPYIPWNALPVSVPTGGFEWQQGQRIAGVSSFGFSGTNVHVIVEAPPAETPRQESTRPLHLLSLSARGEEALQTRAAQLAQMLDKENVELADVCVTANAGRSHLGHRLAIVAENAEQAKASLLAAAKGETSTKLARGQAPATGAPPIAFLFTGQGSQYAGMGKRIYQTNPVFRASLDHCTELMRPHLGRSLLDVVYPADSGVSLLDQTLYTQTSLFALEYALAQSWLSWGIEPSAVLGHSLGEYVAACVAGVLSLEDAVTLVATRARLMQDLPPGGAMAAVFAGEEQLRDIVERRRDRLAIAAVNGPQNTVISGESTAIDEAMAKLEKAGIRAERLRVSHAFHSPLMEPMLSRFRDTASRITARPPRISLVSNLTGRPFAAGDAIDADYWCRHLRNAVRFAAGMQTLREAGARLFVEIGPGTTLLGMGRRCLPELQAEWLPSLRPGRDDWDTLLGTLATLYVQGVKVDWSAFEKDQGRRITLPLYPFQRKRFWIEETHQPLAALQRTAKPPTAFEVSTKTRPELADHCVYHMVVVPASWHVSLLLAAAVQARGQGVTLEDFTFPEAIVLPDEQARKVQLLLTPGEKGSDPVTCQVLSLSQPEGEPTTHATATLPVVQAARLQDSLLLDTLQQRCPREESADEFYRRISDGGIQLTGHFRWVEQLWAGEQEALGRLRLSRSDEEQTDGLPAGLIDSCFQLVAATIAGVGSESTAYVPFAVERVRFHGRGSGTLWCHVTLRPGTSREIFTADLQLFEESGRVVASFEGLHLKRAEREALLRGLQGQTDNWVHEIAWRALPALDAPTSEAARGVGPWLVLADRGGVGAALVERLQQLEAECRLVHPGGSLTPFEKQPGSVVDLRALDESEGAALGNFLDLIQTLLRSGLSTPPRLWLVTRGAQAVDATGTVSPWQTALWGLAQTAAREHPELRVTSLDLDSGDAITGLLAEVCSGAKEEQLALRGGSRHAARLVRRQRGEPGTKVPGTGAGTFVPGSLSYLITGGLGGLGLLVARWLVEKGARHLTLVGRSAPSEEARRVLAELEKAGAQISIVSADVSRMEDVMRVLAEMTVPLGGVIHAAGVLEDTLLLEQSREKLDRVLAPKALGAWNLHTLTADRKLDFFVLFSSVASLLGTPGQGAYAAANAFLDGLAVMRRRAGLPALSVNWGPWAEAGMAARSGETAKKGWQAQGISSIPPRQGLDLLDRLLGQDVASVAVLHVNWPRFLQQFPAGFVPPLLEEIARTEKPAQAAPRDTALLRRLVQADDDGREDILLEYVRGEVASVLRLDKPDTLDVQQPLNEAGMDSLMAVELRNRLGSAVGRTLSPTLLYSQPTIEKLTRYLLKEVLDLRAAAVELAKPQAAVDEPIAIIGLSCRLPGAESAAEFWKLLHDGVDAVKEVPADRWDINAYYDADADAPGKMYTRRGGFLNRVDGFDAGFFGIAPREAVNMDPQQRLLLEVSWEALEDAGIAAEQLAGSLTGVYVGISTIDYSQRQGRDIGLDGINAYTGTGNAFSVAAGRISYILGLQGPNFPVDTACSSSLLSVHLACQALRSGECRLALAAGVNLILTPEGHIYFCKLRATSPDGKCKTFDASADGYVRGEGCGVVVLKRLSDALADGDNIQAVIRGSAVNHDGRSNGLTAPNGEAQEAVIRQALSSANMAPAEVDYVEAHGTGTALGDPIEVQALGAVLGKERGGRAFLLGSVKTNIGHLEAGAGVASLIKVVLALQHGVIPPHLHFTKPSPYIPWSEIPVRIPTRPTPWPAGEKKRVAGVSSFGFSGTNVHLVVEESPTVGALVAEVARLRDGSGNPNSGEFGYPPGVPHLLTLSARTPAALRKLAGRFADHLGQREYSLADVCYTAGAGRSTFAHRLALPCQSIAEAREKLAEFAAGQSPAGIHVGQAERERKPKLASLERGSDDERTFLDRLAELYIHGATIDWKALQKDGSRRKVSLPTYPFQRQRYWYEASANGQAASRGAVHSILGVCVQASLREMVFEKQLSVESPTFLADHRLAGQALVPAAMYVDLILAAAAEALGPDARIELANLQIPEALLLADDAPVAFRLNLHRDGEQVSVEGRSRDAVHVRAVIRMALKEVATATLAEARALCTQPVKREEFYQRIAERGLELGVAFQLVEELWRGSGEALGHLRLHGREDDQHAFAPPLLDACLQVVGAALPDSQQSGSVLLVGIDRFILHRRPGMSLWSHAVFRTQPASEPIAAAAGFVADVNVFDESGEPVASVLGLRFQHIATRSKQRLEQCLYDLVWRPGVHRDQGLDPDYLPTPAALSARRHDWQQQLITANQLDHYRDMLAPLEQLSAAYVVRALKQLGWQPGQRFPDAAEAGIADGQRRLFERMIEIASEADVALDADSLSARLRQEYPACEPELRLLDRCGGSLVEVLQGWRDPLPLLFPENDSASVEHLYQSSPFLCAYNGLVENVFAGCLDGLPSGRTLRVLEIGAGTGGTTVHVLPRLPAQRTDYVFTDVSAMFLGRAQEKLSAYPFVRYQVLDIEQDAEQQGFAPCSFDIVLAANVLHATADLKQALANARRLLAPGGLLVLMEGTKRQPWLDIIFGLTPGWWRFRDTDLRPSYPLLSRGQWLDVLRETGFAEASALPEEEDNDGLFARQAILVARTPAALSKEQGAWLIFADRSGIAQALAQRLEQRSQRCLVVGESESGPDFQSGQTRPDWKSGPQGEADFDRVLAQDLGTERPGCRGVIYLCGAAKGTEEKLLDSIDSSSRGTLQLLQAIVRAGWPTPPKLWMATYPGLLGAPLWGLGRVTSREHPQLWGGLIALDPTQSAEQNADSLIAQIWKPDGEDQVAFHEGVRSVARLERRQQPEPAEPLRIVPDATYLITGGLGGLGLRVARWLVDRGARSLVLCGREQGSEEARETVRVLEKESGATVRIMQADVASEERVRALLAEIGPNLRGIIHAAGVFEDSTLANQTWDGFSRVLAPKVRGAWNLHRLTQDRPLDFFVLFSSAASVLSTTGLGNYTAANVFLDALAQHRRESGLQGLSISWGPWAGVGMAQAVGSERERQWALAGLDPFPAEMGLAALETLLRQQSAHALVASIRWGDYLSVNGDTPLLAEMARESSTESHGETSAEGALVERILAAASDSRVSLVLEHLRQRVAHVLNMAESDLSNDGNLLDLGLDSLMVMELLNGLKKTLRLTIYPRELYDRPQLMGLARYLTSEIERAHGKAEVAKPQAARKESQAAKKPRRALTHRNPPMLFLLSSPRSGSTLLRVMLQGHPRLFSPPELHLLPFDSMNDRQQGLGLSYMGEGLQRSIMDLQGLDAVESKRIVDDLQARDASVQEVYGLLQKLAGERLLVDKTPTYAADYETLERAEELFDGAKYLYLTRHPYAVIESFVRMRMDKLIDVNEVDPLTLAEHVWTSTNGNVLRFFKKVDPARRFHLCYEDLVRDPETATRSLCEFLGITFNPALLTPYEGQRMLDGVHAQSIGINDPNFMQHDRIDAALGDVWKTIRLSRLLGEPARQVASSLGYELPHESASSTVMRERIVEVRGLPLCLCEWGPEDGPTVLCVHGILEQGASWQAVAAPLAARGFHVVAPDLRGHGRSGHISANASYQVFDFVADLDGISAGLGGKPMTLVGHSLGGILASLLAAARPERFERLILIEKPLSGAGPEGEDAEKFTAQLDYLAAPPEHRVFANLEEAASRLRQATPALDEALAQKLAERISEPCAGGVRWRWDVRLRTRTGITLPVIDAGRYLGMLKTITAPVHLIFGDASGQDEALARLRETWPDAAVNLVHGGHNLHIETPAELARIIAEAMRHEPVTT
jgi:acyl transferase domain-containing protein/pimeloyl-ACP methyl ester carboxylesterase/aryl carrier-like protein